MQEVLGVACKIKAHIAQAFRTHMNTSSLPWIHAIAKSHPQTTQRSGDGVKKKAGFPRQPGAAAVRYPRGTSYGKTTGCRVLRKRGGTPSERVGVRGQEDARGTPGAR